MVKCGIEGCTNYQGKDTGGKIVKFFCFPKNEKLSQEWLRACGRGVKLNLAIARICSDHFGENDWKLQDILLEVPEHKRKLKTGAIPSINICQSKCSSKREEKLKKQERQELIEQAISNYDRKYVMKIARCFEEPEVDAPKITKKPGRSTISEQDDPLAAPGPEAERLLKENRALKMSSVRLRKRLQKAETAISSLKKIFTEGQIKRIKNPNKNYKWGLEDILYAASLYSAGPNGYAQLVKRMYPLPPPPLLKKWATALKLHPGTFTNIVNTMSELNYDEIDRLCILSFHEISLNVVKHRAENENEPQFKRGQIVIVRGLTQDWKQIIHYSYDCTSASMVVKDIVQKLNEINFTVVAVVSGVGHIKLNLWGEIGVNKDHPCAEIIKGKKVYFFGNVPHLIKQVRNYLIESGFVVNGTNINVDSLRELLGPDMPDLELTFKFTEAHISPKKITRQRVHLAWELFSQPVANALRKCVSMGKIYSTNAIECSDLIALFSDWLDLFNAKCISEGEMEGSLAYGLALEDQNQTITSMNELITSFSRSRLKTLLSFQRGILLNNASLMQLREYLMEKYNIDHVLTHRFNQDDLELSLKIRRGKIGIVGQPTALEFKYKVNSCVLSTLKAIKETKK